MKPESPAIPVNDVLRVAAVQMVSGEKVDQNLLLAERLIARAVAEGARLVALPEDFSMMSDRKPKPRELPGDGPVQAFLSAQAKRHQICLIGGTIFLSDPVALARGFNTCLVFGPTGQQIARYDKIHLFRWDPSVVEPASEAGVLPALDEGRTVAPGRTPVTFDLDAGGDDISSPPANRRWRIGLSVCFDLRFPELYRIQSPVDLAVVPSAFLFHTGRAHWFILLRARAIENQCYVLAPAQGGLHEGGRHTWGHTMLIDPWGVPMAAYESGEGIVTGTMERVRLRDVRRQLPALASRCL